MPNCQSPPHPRSLEAEGLCALAVSASNGRSRRIDRQCAHWKRSRAASMRPRSALLSPAAPRAASAASATMTRATRRREGTRGGCATSRSTTPGAVDMGMFGSKSDPLLLGQAAQVVAQGHTGTLGGIAGNRNDRHRVAEQGRSHVASWGRAQMPAPSPAAAGDAGPGLASGPRRARHAARVLRHRLCSLRVPAHPRCDRDIRHRHSRPRA
jgi:hypothetical protein